MRVAIFGGSFNPPHVAHVMAAVCALSLGQFERVVVVPVFAHPFSKELAPFDHRVRMAELAMGWLPSVQISRVEADLGGPSLTLKTLEHLQGRHPEWQMRLVVGSDVLDDAPRWHHFEAVVRLAPLFVVGRAAAPLAGQGASPPGEVSTPALPAISSTELRALLARGDDEACRLLRTMLPATVLAYIAQQGLYRDSAEPAPRTHHEA